MNLLFSFPNSAHKIMSTHADESIVVNTVICLTWVTDFNGVQQNQREFVRGPASQTDLSFKCILCKTVPCKIYFAITIFRLYRTRGICQKAVLVTAICAPTLESQRFFVTAVQLNLTLLCVTDPIHVEQCSTLSQLVWQLLLYITHRRRSHCWMLFYEDVYLYIVDTVDIGKVDPCLHQYLNYPTL